MRYAVIAGGTGSVKLVRGLASVVKEPFAVICNVGDNIWLHGLYICPDVDTIMYGLAGLLDDERGWGIKGDTFHSIAQLARLGGGDWFRLGDMDLATHLLRTNMLKAGMSLTKITDILAKRLSISHLLLPASDTHFETRIVTAAGEMHLQEFWVKRKGIDTVLDVKYAGLRDAKPSDKVIKSIKDAEKIFIAPGNPISSIRPTVSIPDIGDALKKTVAEIIAVSPIVGNEPISGPAGKMMQAISAEVSAVGVARLYSEFADKILIDVKDAHLKSRIARFVKPITADIVMKGKADEKAVAKLLIGL